MQIGPGGGGVGPFLAGQAGAAPRPLAARCNRLFTQGRRGRRRADQFDAVDRARGNAQLAADAFVGDHRMHALRRTDDGVERACIDASRTADAALRIDARDDGSGAGCHATLRAARAWLCAATKARTCGYTFSRQRRPLKMP